MGSKIDYIKRYIFWSWMLILALPIVAVVEVIEFVKKQYSLRIRKTN